MDTLNSFSCDLKSTVDFIPYGTLPWMQRPVRPQIKKTTKVNQQEDPERSSS